MNDSCTSCLIALCVPLILNKFWIVYQLKTDHSKCWKNVQFAVAPGCFLALSVFLVCSSTSCFLVPLLSLLCCRMALPALGLLCLSLIFSVTSWKWAVIERVAKRDFQNSMKNERYFHSWVYEIFLPLNLNGAILEESCSNLLISYTRPE